MRHPSSLSRRLVRPAAQVAALLLAVSAGGLGAPSPAAAAPFDPRTLGAGMAGPPTQLMVLGTDHLAHMPANYRSEFLAPLLDRLAAYGPQIITVEGLSGPECEYLTRYKAILPGLADSYCWDTDAARAATGLDVPQATAAVEEALRGWPKTPTASQRRRLAALFLAANDRASAAVQWLRLPLAERRQGDGLDAALVALLEKVAQSKNENIAIAAALAARLGLDRVYPADDHTADSITATLGPDFETAIQGVWAAPLALKADFEAREKALTDGAGLLALFRFINDPPTGRAMIEADMGQALKQRTPQLYGRQYLAWWETRNLRMAANVRSAFGNRPGARVLCVVGATHKAYFEAYLGMMSDVKIVSASTLFDQGPTISAVKSPARE